MPDACLSGRALAGSSASVRLPEELQEKALDSDRRAGMGGMVVGYAGHPGCTLVRKAVHRAAVDNELPVGAGFPHFLYERRNVGHGNMRVERAVANQNSGVDRTRSSRLDRGEAAMNAHNSSQRRAAARQL